MKHQDPNIFAKVIADSESEGGHRLTTMHVRCPRVVLAEFNTHRAISRNSASSRAVPTHKFRERVRSHPYFPRQWNVAGKGMTAAGPMTAENSAVMQGVAEQLLEGTLRWHATAEGDFGTAKEQLNRYLEPWLYTDILVSATEWSNFFFLRCSPHADPAMQMTADAMLEAFLGSTPAFKCPGEWHLPFLLPEDRLETLVDQLKFCAARCARVSYFNFGEEGKVDHEADRRTHDKLRASLHLSPFEHCAQAMSSEGAPVRPRRNYCSRDVLSGAARAHPGGRSGNFTGWAQYRETLRSDIEKALSCIDLPALLAERKEAA